MLVKRIWKEPEKNQKRTRKELHSQEHLKYKLGTELDNLDVLAEDYDDEYEAVQLKLDEVYDRIEILEKRIRKLKKRMEAYVSGSWKLPLTDREADCECPLYKNVIVRIGAICYNLSVGNQRAGRLTLFFYRRG